MISTTRWMFGALLAVIGAVAAIWSVFLEWYGGRNGSDIRIQDIFNQMTLQSADSLGSLLIPMAVAAVLVLAGLIVGWRWLWALAGIVVLVTCYLWALRQAQTTPGLHASLVGAGPSLAMAGGILMIVGSVFATRRTRRTPTPAQQLSPEWTPNASTQVGQTEGTGQPRVDEREHI